jgi:hypothetical protein
MTFPREQMQFLNEIAELAGVPIEVVAGVILCTQLVAIRRDAKQ